MKLKKFLKNNKGASMMDYFIISAVAILVGGAIFVMGSKVNDGIREGTKNIVNINKAIKGEE